MEYGEAYCYKHFKSHSPDTPCPRCAKEERDPDRLREDKAEKDALENFNLIYTENE